MKIKILMENKAVDERFSCGHGLSIYIETASHKIMMDAGPDGRFSDNAKELGVDIKDVDMLVLSHGHYDHAGGISRFMRENEKAVIYVAAGYGLPHYDKDGKYIGVEPAIVSHPRVRVLDSDLVIDDEVSILGFRGARIIDDPGTFGMTEGSIDTAGIVEVSPERFEHEHYLVVSEEDKKVLFSGCTHRGIVNITDWAKEIRPDVIVGGFHLMSVPEERFYMLDRVMDELEKHDCVYYTGHCTGQAQYDYMKQRMGDKLFYAGSGAEFEL